MVGGGGSLLALVLRLREMHEIDVELEDRRMPDLRVVLLGKVGR
jgi:hypothetical protein